MRTAIRNATVLDTVAMTYREGQRVVIEDGVIVEVDDDGPAPADHFMAHLAFTEGETEWGEHLTADEYPNEQ